MMLLFKGGDGNMDGGDDVLAAMEMLYYDEG